MMATGVQGLGAGVLSVGRGMVHHDHFLRMKVCQLVDLQEHTSSFQRNGVYSLKWRLTERYPKWGTLADPRPGRAAADQSKSSDFLQELRISGFPRFGVSPTCFRAK